MVKFKSHHTSLPRAMTNLALGVRYGMENIMKGGHINMTRNQIEYLKVRGDREKNKLDNLMARKNLEETNRANLVREAETERSNRARESTNALQVAINSQALTETQRANLARESETNRANLANESIARSNAGTNALNARTNQYNAEIAAINAATNQQLADTKDYLASMQASRNASSISSDAQQRKLQQQQINESEARQKYYETQSGMSAPAGAVRDVFQTLKTAGELVLLFQ